MSETFCLVYNDHRRIKILKDYRKSMDHVVLSKPGQRILVNREQRDNLVKLKNGTRPIFTEEKMEG